VARMPDSVAPAVLAEVAASGASDAGGLPVSLLGDFLEAVTAAVTHGQPLSADQMMRYEAIGDDAARKGVALRALLDLYLSSAWRLWRHLPTVRNSASDPQAVVVAGEVMLHAVDDAVAALAEGYQLARRSLVRHEESARWEFIDDLLTGGSDVAGVLRRAAEYGLDLTAPHSVAVVRAEAPFADGTPLIGVIERAVQGSKGDADSLVASKQGLLVIVFPSPDLDAVEHVTTRLSEVLDVGSARTVGGRLPAPVGSWQVGVGRSSPGVRGVVLSYQEARDALDLATRLKLTSPVIKARDLLVYTVLLRDHDAILDLVDNLLTPLRQVRGGAKPLLETLEAYFSAGSNTTRAARDLHMSVRSVAYRLDRVRQLTGLDPTGAQDRFALHVAVLGARLLDWPSEVGN
jgi:sugar diacid utilization regulator